MKSPRTLAYAALVLVSGSGCGDDCHIVPTSVALALHPLYLEAPGEITATAAATLGSSTCGPDPTEVIAYHWTLDGEPLEGANGESLGAQIVFEADTPGVHSVEVRVEDDLGMELPSVGQSSFYVY